MDGGQDPARRCGTGTVNDPDDPKGLIREAYRIDGITDAECRSILIDWALSLSPMADAHTALARLSLRYVAANPGHPMNPLLAEAAPTPTPTRRGGATGRRAKPR